MLGLASAQTYRFRPKWKKSRFTLTLILMRLKCTACRLYQDNHHIYDLIIRMKHLSNSVRSRSRESEWMSGIIIHASWNKIWIQTLKALICWCNASWRNGCLCICPIFNWMPLVCCCGILWVNPDKLNIRHSYTKEYTKLGISESWFLHMCIHQSYPYLFHLVIKRCWYFVVFIRNSNDLLLELV